MAEPIPSQATQGKHAATVAGGLPIRLAVWLAVVAALVLIVAFASVTLHYDLSSGQLAEISPAAVPPSSQPILRVWLDHADQLPHVSHQGLLRGLFDAALLLFAIGTALVLGLAMMAGGQPAPDSPEPLPPSDGPPAATLESTAVPVEVPIEPPPDEPA